MAWKWMLAVLLVQVMAGQSLEKETRFHVKLSHPVGGQVSKAGAAVGAVIISPESFLGGRFMGRVRGVKREGSGVRVEVVFERLEHRGKVWAVESKTMEFVNSIGHAGVDEQERAARVVEGAFVSAHADLLIDEGAELRLLVRPVGAAR